MSLAELLPAARSLSRTEKLRLIQVLAAELAEADDSAHLASEAKYPVWSPFDAHQAAAVLLDVLEAEKARP
ncbi:hypothetical protein [Paludisphaera rhizosphaerae]|uniref:hypothetical protein n=1 Tax=Paludisphaera rhizosphaerae TaxID=2711216 RepID=UPI0013EA73BE|nr:hypothetical protein [Paludisphaera rhizosphaerae]